MPGNMVVNASFADGTIGFSGTNLSVDESVRGYEGRAVLKSTIVAAFPGSTQMGAASGSGKIVVPGQVLEVFGHHAFTRGTSNLYVNYYASETGAFIGQKLVALQSAGDDNPRLGLAKSYNFSHERVTVPVGVAFARLFVYTTNTSAGAAEILLMKPYLEILPSAKTKYRCWDPGPSANVDLSLPIWPPELPHIRADSFSAVPIPVRKGFKTDAGVMITKKLVNTPWYTVQASLSMDQELHAIFDKFFRDGAEPFWFVRPDTLQLCQATWLDNGDPVYSGLGSDKMVTFGLQIRVM